jgi:hypothetical protein
MKRVKRVFAAAVFAGIVAIPTPAIAFHHGGVPADECAPEAAGQNAGNNQTASSQILNRNPEKNPPFEPVGTPGDEATPSECPAPQK